jgi:hypothetical protein
MEEAKRFWSPERWKALFLTTLPGLLAGWIAFSLILTPAPGHFSRWQYLVGARTGGLLGAVVAIFAFVFPGAEEKVQRWWLWGIASLVVGLAGGAITALLWKQGALHPPPHP